MSNKTPEQRALAFARDGKYQVREFGCLSGTEATAYDAHLAGQADFIKHRLPKLLEMARDGLKDGCSTENDTDIWWTYSIAQLVAMAEKGEV